MSAEHPVYKDFEKAVENLNEVLGLKNDPIQRDAAFKRFELCFDLAWKSLKVYARKEGIDCYSPRNCIKTAFQLELIDYDENWLSMIEDRNRAAHIYRAEIAESIYLHLPGYLELYKKLLKGLKDEK